MRRRGWLEVIGTAAALAVVLVALVYVTTHVVAPRLLTHYERFPGMATVPKKSVDAHGHAADPVNIALVGSEDEVRSAMRDARWSVADSLSHASDVAIARSVLLNRPDSTAPVSSAFLYGRKQDLAFEQEVGSSARRRHHMRLWKVSGLSYNGRDVWIGTASFDRSAGISHRALRPTHHVAPDIDQEREDIEVALARAGRASATFRVTGLGIRVNDRNADGDRIDTDGELRVVVLTPDGVRHAPPQDPGTPWIVTMKDAFWSRAHRLL